MGHPCTSVKGHRDTWKAVCSSGVQPLPLPFLDAQGPDSQQEAPAVWASHQADGGPGVAEDGQNLVQAG